MAYTDLPVDVASSQILGNDVNMKVVFEDRVFFPNGYGTGNSIYSFDD